MSTDSDRFPLVEALSAALGQIATRGEDQAAVAVARRYAAAIDEAAELARLAEQLWRELPAGDDVARRQLAALERRVTEQAVLGELGPKLVAVLVELGMTPRARAGVTGKGGGAGDNGGGTKADELRARRAARQHAAPAVD